MTNTKELALKGAPPPDGVPRTLTGAQLSSSGQHLSTTGSGIRKLFEQDRASAEVPLGAHEAVAATEEMARPKFTKGRRERS